MPQQDISDSAPKRADFGLLQDAFVFCCFNGLYKFNPELFGAWMEIFKSVPNGVFWLYRADPVAQANLKQMTSESGVDPDRLVFTSTIAKPDHLARLRLADLALDTFPCNGHTTTSDALWAGVPVLALKGQHFASNVSASILQAVGLPELIAANQPEYIARAIEIACDPSLLSQLRQSLQHNLKEAPWFNTALFVRDLEKAYQEMWRRFRAKKPVREIDVRELV